MGQPPRRGRGKEGEKWLPRGYASCGLWGGLTKLEGLKAVLLAEEVDVVGDIQLMQVGEDTLDLESLRLKVVLQKQLEAPKGNMGENNGVHSLEEEERDEEVGSTPFRRKEQERPKKK